MEQYFDWFAASVRSVGASFPVAASIIQAQAEYEAKQMGKDIKHVKERIGRIEDPISNLHEDVQTVSKKLFHLYK